MDGRLKVLVMDYEKRYKGALERAKDMLAYKEVRQEDMEYLFPELKESEDEKMRKMCIRYLDWEYQHCYCNEDKTKIEKCIAWLEKQGEQTQLDYEHADIPQKDFAPIGVKETRC